MSEGYISQDVSLVSKSPHGILEIIFLETETDLREAKVNLKGQISTTETNLQMILMQGCPRKEALILLRGDLQTSLG
jgi:hypothetical protein